MLVRLLAMINPVIRQKIINPCYYSTKFHYKGSIHLQGYRRVLNKPIHCTQFTTGTYNIIMNSSFIYWCLLLISVRWPKFSGAEICMNYGCRQLAEILNSRLDFNVDPCEDFAKFACKGITPDLHQNNEV